MHWIFVLVFVLIGTVVLWNIHEVLPRLVQDINRPRVLIYLGTLFFLGYMVIHLTYRVLEFARMADAVVTERPE